VQVTLTGTRPNQGRRLEECDEEQQLISRASCASVGAILTSIARIVVYKHMLTLRQHGAELLKVSCDSIYFTLPQSNFDPLQYSESFGYWKQIYPGELLSLCQVGVMNYGVLYKDKHNNVISEVKCSGLTMCHLTTADIAYSTYSDALRVLINEELGHKRSTLKSKKWMSRRTIVSKTGSVHVLRQSRSVFNRNLLSRRILNLSSDQFETKPYGYCK
jgi:hypothetical protein